jgi:hypothetical protein
LVACYQIRSNKLVAGYQNRSKCKLRAKYLFAASATTRYGLYAAPRGKPQKRRNLWFEVLPR